MPDPVRCPICGTLLLVAGDRGGEPGPCPKREPVVPLTPLATTTPPEMPPRSRPTEPRHLATRPVRRWPVVRLASGIWAAYGAITVSARWASGHAPPPADDVGYQVGRVIGGMIFWGVIGLVTGLVIRIVISVNQHRLDR